MNLLVRDLSTTVWIHSAFLGLFMYIANCTLTSCPNVVVPLFLPVAIEGNIYKDMRGFVVQKRSITPFCSSQIPLLEKS